ncbi:MAG: amidohydrolase family protein [Methanomicrobiales archaeon]|jgi:dihydroorotase|nr:amidohydrolase family protein [Methanomicrobiales archaeon]
MDHSKTVLRDARLPDGRVADVTIVNGFISHIGSSDRADSDETLFCHHQLLVPASIDMHVHMRDGVQAAKETWESGTQSALAGGVCLVVDQPNTVPPLVTKDVFLDRVEVARTSSYTHFMINGGITNETTSADISDLLNSGVLAFGEIFYGPSSYGEPISRDALSSALCQLRDSPVLITVHAETVSHGDDVSLKTHDELRSIAGECTAIFDVTTLARAFLSSSTKLHICHVSNAQGIEMIAPLPFVSSEVMPHHLFLSRDMLPDKAWYKMNPPLRTEQERKRLWEWWPHIDVIASDHAPHTTAEKEEEFFIAPSGVPGIETMVPLLMAEVKRGRISLSDLMYKTVSRPAELLGISPPCIAVGFRADLCLYPDAITCIDANNLHSKAGWSPFEGMDAIFPLFVLVSGQVAYDAGSDRFYKQDIEWFSRLSES